MILCASDAGFLHIQSFTQLFLNKSMQLCRSDTLFWKKESSECSRPPTSKSPELRPQTHRHLGWCLFFTQWHLNYKSPRPGHCPQSAPPPPGLLPLQPRQSHWCGWTHTWYERSKALEKLDKKLLKTVVGEITNDKYSHRTWDMFYKVLT